MEPCPPLALLRRLLASELEDEDQALLESHVESCDPCQEQLARLADDPETGKWRKLLLEGSSAFEEGIAADFLQTLRVARPGSNSTGIRFPGPPTSRGPLGEIGPYAIT